MPERESVCACFACLGLHTLQMKNRTGMLLVIGCLWLSETLQLRVPAEPATYAALAAILNYL
jgi:p-aminobenzoyl-glutamate transporter AbgT